MIKVSQAREMLEQYPDNAFVYAYEGEVIGLVVVESFDGQYNELGVIMASEDDPSADEARQTDYDKDKGKNYTCPDCGAQTPSEAEEKCHARDDCPMCIRSICKASGETIRALQKAEEK